MPSTCPCERGGARGRGRTQSSEERSRGGLQAHRDVRRRPAAADEPHVELRRCTPGVRKQRRHAGPELALPLAQALRPGALLALQQVLLGVQLLLQLPRAHFGLLRLLLQRRGRVPQHHQRHARAGGARSASVIAIAARQPRDVQAAQQLRHGRGARLAGAGAGQEVRRATPLRPGLLSCLG